MKTVVLSGFRRFGDYLANSTAIVARQLDQKVLGGVRVESIVFSAAIPRINRGKQLVGFARRVDASAIISLGMASDKSGLCVEHVAQNRIDGKYVPTSMKGARIDVAQPYGHELELDLAPWRFEKLAQSCMTAGVPIMRRSRNAGGFCCNHLMWQLHQAQLGVPAKKRISAIFLHVPCSLASVADLDAFTQAGKVTMEPSEIIKGLALLIKHASI